jgi:hypothetical protein
MVMWSGDFWLGRLADALDKAAKAPSERSRNAYFELADHYRALHDLSGRSHRPAAPRGDCAAHAATDSGQLDFRSIHDALMEAA